MKQKGQVREVGEVSRKGREDERASDLGIKTVV